MKDFYTVVDVGGGALGVPRMIFATLFSRTWHRSLREAQAEAKKRCNMSGGRFFVMKSMGFVHLPPLRAAWRRTKAER